MELRKLQGDGENAIFGTFLICNIPDIITQSRSLGQKRRVIWTWKMRPSCNILVMNVKGRGHGTCTHK